MHSRGGEQMPEIVVLVIEADRERSRVGRELVHRVQIAVGLLGPRDYRNPFV